MKKMRCSLFLFAMMLCIPFVKVDAASVKKPVIGTVKMVPGKTTIKLKVKKGYKYYYTLNGKAPKKGTKSAKVYNTKKGIVITKKTTVKIATYKGSKHSKVLTKTYKVYRKPSLNQKSFNLYVGNKYQLKVKNADTKITWKSSNTKIATVSSKGLVGGKSKGSATIKCKVNGVLLSCKVTVKPRPDNNTNNNTTTNNKVIKSVVTFRGKNIVLGSSAASLVISVGQPNRVDKVCTVYSNTCTQRYVYNEFGNFIMFDVVNGIVRGWYTNSPNITVDGLKCGMPRDIIASTMRSKYGVLDSDYSLWEYPYDYRYYKKGSENYYRFFTDGHKDKSPLYGKIVSIVVSDNWHVVMGNSGYDNGISVDSEYSLNECKESLDILNGWRYLHGKHSLEWDPKGYALKEAKAHTMDMLNNHFLGHNSTRYSTMQKRYDAAYSDENGVYVSYYESENAASGESAIINMHTLYNSWGHFNNMVNNEYHKQYAAALAVEANSFNARFTQEFCCYK